MAVSIHFATMWDILRSLCSCWNALKLEGRDIQPAPMSVNAKVCAHFVFY